MHPFFPNNSNHFPILKSPSSLPHLNDLFNLQTLQRMQALQNLQTLQNQSNINCLDVLRSSHNTQPFLSSLASTGSHLNHQNQPLRFPHNLMTDFPPHALNGAFNSNPGLDHHLASQLNNILLAWKLQNNVQTELYKSQLAQLLEMQKRLDLKMKETQTSVSTTVTSETQKSSPVKTESETAVIPQPLNKRTLKNQLRNLIQFVLSNFGRVSDDQLDLERSKYKGNVDLVAVFDALTTKYSSTIKTKEEMIKYVLRKAFKFIKNDLKKQKRLDSKEASTVLCKRYFKDYNKKLPQFGNEEDFFKFVLPFRKSSKNKTMNSSFISEVFASEDFRKDYENYLEDLEEILENDNNGKIERFVNFIEECIKKGKVQDIQKYKRIPWPLLWITNTKKIASELLTAGSSGTLNSLRKKTRTSSESINSSESQSESGGTSESSPSTN